LDRATVEVYENIAEEYAARRPPRVQGAARRFARLVPMGAMRADIGCGPGRYTADLGAPIVALDAAAAMLDLVPQRAPWANRVRADLEHLPFRRGGLAGAWTNLAYQHIPKGRLPLALGELHRSLAVDAPVEVALFEGSGEGAWPNDEFPGRLFALWSAEELTRLAVGAGFDVGAIKHDSGQLRLRLTRRRTLADVVGPDMRLLVCGLNPSLYAADGGIPFARPGNRFWTAARDAGLLTTERDPWTALRSDGVGFTDLVKRATVAADELRADEYRIGLERVRHLIEWLHPKVVCFVGLAGWRVAIDRDARAGLQPLRLGGAMTYVMPSTSGLNAHATPALLAEHFRAAAALARG
jgi:TDG/mug DNA glycosylase family protein